MRVPCGSFKSVDVTLSRPMVPRDRLYQLRRPRTVREGSRRTDHPVLSNILQDMSFDGIGWPSAFAGSRYVDDAAIKSLRRSAMNTTSQSPAISLRGLFKKFGQLHAVDDVSRDIVDGEFFSMLGPSGSGKSTATSTL